VTNDALTPQPGHDDVWRHGSLSCSACGYRFDGTGSLVSGDQRAPDDGDFTICFRCGEVMVYVIGALGVSVREPSTTELAEFARIPGATAEVRRLHEFWVKGGQS
jgi:hypothetical protein